MTVTVAAGAAVSAAALPTAAESCPAGTAGAERAGAESAGAALFATIESAAATGLPAARVTGGAALRLMKKAGAMAMAIISRIAHRVRRSMVSLDHDIRGRDRRHPDETGGTGAVGAPRARSPGGRRSA